MTDNSCKTKSEEKTSKARELYANATDNQQQLLRRLLDKERSMRHRVRRPNIHLDIIQIIKSIIK
jgi:hypothetical protein